MALLHCPECNHEVSEKAAICPNCGYPFASTSDSNRLTVSDTASPNKINKHVEMSPKMRIVCRIIAIIILFCVFCAIVLFVWANTYSSLGSYAVKSVERLQNSLKHSDSLTLTNDVLIVFADDENQQPTFYTYISYSAENWSGTAIDNFAIFKGFEYLGTGDEVAPSVEAADETYDFQRAITVARLHLNGWNLYGEKYKEHDSDQREVFDCEMISMYKIGLKLHIPCRK